MSDVQYYKAMHFCINTFENLQVKSETLVSIIDSIFSTYLSRVRKQLEIIIEKTNGRELVLLFNEKNLKKTINMLNKGEIRCLGFFDISRLNTSKINDFDESTWISDEVTVIPDQFSFSVTCNYQEKIRNNRFVRDKNLIAADEISFSLSEQLLGNPISKADQGVFMGLFKETFIKTNAVTGYTTFETSGAGYETSKSSLEMVLRTGEYHEFSYRFSHVLRGYHWGNILSEGHIEKLGGIDEILKTAPFKIKEKVDLVDRSVIYLQLTEDINKCSDDELARAREYLRPVLPQDELIIYFDPNGGMEKQYQLAKRLGLVHRILESPKYTNNIEESNL